MLASVVSQLILGIIHGLLFSDSRHWTSMIVMSAVIITHSRQHNMIMFKESECLISRQPLCVRCLGRLQMMMMMIMTCSETYGAHDMSVASTLRSP